MKKKIRELSKGMRAKVSLSLALAHDPQVLILDEPTSGLDTLVRREFLDSMVDLAAGGKTVLLSSHQIVEVERVADYVAILSHGKLLTVARLDELKEQVREITLTLSDTTAEPPRMPGDVLASRRSARQLQYVVRGAESFELDALEHHAAIARAEVRPLGLEEIFVAYLEHAGETRQPLTNVAREDVEVFEP
jgi:ABC-2 type transport system ATP-binding protein